MLTPPTGGAIQLKDAKLVAEQEAQAVVNHEKQHGETDPAVLKELFETAYRQVLAHELGVEE